MKIIFSFFPTEHMTERVVVKCFKCVIDKLKGNIQTRNQEINADQNQAGNLVIDLHKNATLRPFFVAYGQVR